jgi:hypothetical protein
MSPKKYLNKMYSVLNKNKKDIKESWVDETIIQGVRIALFVSLKIL